MRLSRSPGRAEGEALPRVMIVLLVLLSRELLLTPLGFSPTPSIPWLSPTHAAAPRAQRDLTDQTPSPGSDLGSSSFPARPWLSPGHSRWGWGLDLSTLPFLPVHPSPSGAADSLQNAPGIWALPSAQEAPLGLIKCVPCYSNLLLSLGAPESGL